MKNKWIHLPVLVLFWNLNLCAVEDPKELNVIYILADDLGYGDLGCYGSRLNDTPHIDRLAANGLRMTDFQASAWCAPSRRGLMTGCHPNRPWDNEKGKWGRLADAVVIPELLKEAGYRTALIGKWHLEMSEGLHPLDQGFDYWCGTRGSNDWDGPPIPIVTPSGSAPVVKSLIEWVQPF